MKVTLRPLSTEDGPRVLAWRNSPEVAAHMYSDHEIAEDEHAAWLARALTRTDAHYWIIEAVHEPVGFASITLRDAGSARWELGHYIGEAAFRGRGVGAAVEYLILRHAFEVVGARKLWAEVLVDNERAWRLHEAFGYRREALLRAHVVKGGRPRDVVGMGVLKTDWGVARPIAEAGLIRHGFALNELKLSR